MKIIVSHIKKLAVIALIIGFQQLMTHSKPKATAGHPGSTGAPNELTCAQTGCHADASVNPGDLVNSLTFNAGDSLYEPGKTYTITVKVEKAGIDRFGFELVALKDENNTNIGTFKITNSTKTQIINGISPNSSRKYVTHKINGTIPTAPGIGEWTFNWTAPTSSAGPVTFYYATNATNNNNQSSGDQIFLSSFQIDEKNTTGIKEKEKDAFRVFYSYESRQIFVSCNDIQAVSENATIEVRDIQGKLLQVNEINSTVPVKNKAINLNEKIAKGIYLVTYRVDNVMISRKIYID